MNWPQRRHLMLVYTGSLCDGIVGLISLGSVHLCWRDKLANYAYKRWRAFG